MATISQRISLEGSDDIRKKLEELGKAGEKAFKQIQDAARKPITDPAAIDKSKQAFDQLAQAVAKLSPQFKALNDETRKFGSAGEKAGKDVAAGLEQTGAAAQEAGAEFNNLGVRIGVVAGVVAAATAQMISVLGQLKSALSPGELLKGTVETGKAIAEQAAKLKLTVPEWLKLSKAIRDAGVSQETFIAATSKLAKTIADAQGGFVKLAPGQLVPTSKGAVAVMRLLAEQISRVGNSALQARQGIAAFGENWKEIIAVLTGSKAAANAADDVFDKLAKVDRALSPDQAERAARLAKAWDVLGNAIRAAKDQIGTVFIDAALLRAEWLIRLVDGSRELFKTWQQLAEAKKAAFLEGLGDSPAEILFKTLIATGQLLAGVWRDLLVPAGKALWRVVSQVAGQFEGVSKSQVAAFFVTAAAAAVGLAIALKGIGLVLTPIAALLSLVFSPFGVVLLAAAAAAALFWDQLKAGAQQAAALVPGALASMAASFQKLFAGDFAGFWAQFSAAAVEAFQKINAAAQETPWIKSLLDGARTIATELPGAIVLVAKTLIALGDAATWVAEKINKIFGTELTGTGVALVVIIASMTGALSAMAAVAVIVGTAFSMLATIVGGPVAAAIVAAGFIIVSIIAKWDELKAHALDCFTNIRNGINNLITKIGDLVSAIGGIVGDVWNAFAASATSAFQTVIGWVDRLIGKLRAAASWLASVFGGAYAGGPGGAAAAPGHARGGPIGGRGSGTSDSNLAWVSRGEHIMPARAVRQPGVLAFLEALRRSGGNLSRALDGLGRYAGGGLVSMPAFAAGGSVGGMSHVTIAFPGMPSIGGLRAPGDVVEQLQRAAAMAQVRSGGRKPSRYS